MIIRNINSPSFPYSFPDYVRRGLHTCELNLQPRVQRGNLLACFFHPCWTIMSFLYTPLNVFVPYQILRISLKPIIHTNTSPIITTQVELLYCPGALCSSQMTSSASLHCHGVVWTLIFYLIRSFLDQVVFPGILYASPLFPSGLKPSIQLVFDKHLLNWFWAWIQRCRISYTETNHLVDGTLCGSVLLHQWSKAFAANFSSKW